MDAKFKSIGSYRKPLEWVLLATALTAVGMLFLDTSWINRSANPSAALEDYKPILVGAGLYSVLLVLAGSSLFWIQNLRARAEKSNVTNDQDKLQTAERLALALQGSSLAMWRFHVPSMTRSLDEHVFTMIGFQRGDAASDPDFWLHRIHPDDQQAFIQAQDTSINSGQALIETTYRVLHKQGHWIWLLSRVQTLERDANGRTITLIGTYLDITALKTAEQTVLQASNELQAIFESTTESVFVFDKDRKIVRVNKVGRNLHGLFDTSMPMADMMALIELVQPNGELLPPDQWPSRQGMRGEYVKDFEYRNRRKDTGAYVDLESSAIAIQVDSGERTMFVITSRNVTERKKNWLALQASEANLRQSHAELEQRVVARTTELELTGERLREVSARVTAVVGTMADGVLTIDERGTVETINPAAERMFGYVASDVIGMNINMLMPEPYRSDHHAYLERRKTSTATLEAPFEREVSGLRQDGSIFPLELAVNEIQLGDKRKFVGIVRDITALTQATALRKEALKVAEEANLAKTDFLANMSHEIRSPLNAILGLAYLLEQANLDLNTRTMVRKIRASGRMLLSLISDILDMSKIEAGQMMIEQAPFRLRDVIDNVAVALGIAVGEKDIELIVAPLPAGVLAIVGDALRLEQVLINLCSNAIKFTYTGRIEVRTELLTRADSPPMLRFHVQDTGIGIAPELQRGIFSAFTQADTSTTRRFGGTGLGLTICRQLVSLMGGEIGVISTLGEGSKFWFTLPLVSAKDTYFPLTDLTQIDALIADDSDIALKAIGAVAQSLGWQVSTVDSGAAVLAHVLERESAKLPNVVILDWKMPGMDGLATARALREHIPQSACPIVIMATAFSFTTLASQPDAELVDALLYKPVTASGLYNAVMEAQHRRAATVGVLPTLMQMSRDGLAGVRVLVVDDSDINRDVAQRILMGQGATVSLAVDGEDAILWLLSHPDEVDLVLMDVQMPVLDGIEATRRLRRMPQFDDLPIVALTAGAFKSQQDAAIEAGMTHFVSKPFDVPSTIALIQRLRRRANATPVMPSADIVASLVSPPHHEAWPEVNVLHVGQGLQLWSDVMTYHSYLRRFVDGYRHAAADIAANLAKGDRAAAAALAHKLSGVAANLALQDTRRLAGELEKALMGDDDPALILAQLVQALSAAVTAIDQYATSNPRGTDAQPTPGSAPSAPPLSSEQQAVLKVLLVNLLAALDTDNSTPAKKILMSINPLLPPWVLADIWANVVDYDFRGAEASTLQLASGYSIHIGD